MAVKVWADGLTSTAVRFGSDDSVELTLSLQNENVQWNSYQFVLTLPEGIEWAKDSGGKFLYQLSSRHDVSYVLTVHQQDDNHYSVVCYSSNGTPLTGTDGELLSLTIEANDSLRGKQVTATVSEILFSTRDGQETSLDNLSIEIIVTAPLVVTANSYTREYGEANPRFDYTAIGQEMQGIPMIYCEATSSSPVGTYPIVISKGSVENINDSYVNGTLTITKAPLTISVNSITKYQGDPMPELTVTYSGFKNGETESVLITLPTITCVATAESPSGTYPITVSGAESQNYEITYVNGALTVSEALPVYIMALNDTIEYGDPLPQFRYMSEGAPLVGTPAIKCEAVQGSPVGVYNIVIEKGTVANYNDYYINGKLIITKAPLTIAAKATQREYGEATPELSVTYEGFKNGETDTVLTTLPVITCDGKNVGSYPITVGGAEARNYEIIYQEGILTILPAPLTIAANDAQKKYGDEMPEVSVTYEGFKNEETEVVLTSPPVFYCDGKDVGSYPLTVSGAEAQNYDISYHEGTLTISPAPLIIKAQDCDRIYGEETPAFSLTYEGFKYDDTEAVLSTQPVFRCDGKAVGNYPIIVSGSEAQNYEISYQEGTLTISPAPLSIKAQDCERIYGEETPSFSVTYDGFKYDDTETELSTPPVISCDGRDVGNYPIMVSGATAQNYEISYTEGTLTITPAPLTITANDVNQEYGDGMPTLSVTYDGFKYGETELVLSTMPMIDCQGVDVGTYPINVSGAAAKNYKITHVDGMLTITPAILTVTAKDASRYDGVENPPFEVEYSGWKLDDDVSVLTEVPIASSMADENSLPGEYPITVSGGAAQNYVLQYVAGTLTVIQLPSYIVPYNNMTFHIPDALIPEVTLKVAADVSHVTIPSKVQYRGKEWIVTEVSDSVFMGREKLVTAEIPATIKKIGKDVFGDCSHLAAIVWRAPVKMTSSMMGDFSNPNLLLYMADKTNALEDVTNVIDLNDMMAERILLKDDDGTNDFYCPLAFTANEISYTHEYSQETKSGSSQGWESLVLPFDVTEVTHQEKGRIHPFAKLTSQQIINGEKPFWLYTFTKDNDFKEADAIRANTPYIISMPNEKDLWDDYILKGQVTFRATNAKVHATSEASGVQGVNKAFTPNYRKETVADYFLLNVEDRYNDHAEGSVFARGRRGAHPFEAYFTTTADVKEFGVFEKEDLTPVPSPVREGKMGAMYDMQGRQIVNGKLSNGKLPKGLYIVNGKKVSVK